VAWENGEMGGDAPELLVFRFDQGDLAVALVGATLTEDRQFLLEVGALDELVDAFVDLAEERLLPCDLVGRPIALISWLRHRTLRPESVLLIRGFVAHRSRDGPRTRFLGSVDAGAPRRRRPGEYHRSGAIPSKLGRR
jgi:hypothetical protein